MGWPAMSNRRWRKRRPRMCFTVTNRFEFVFRGVTGTKGSWPWGTRSAARYLLNDTVVNCCYHTYGHAVQLPIDAGCRCCIDLIFFL